MKSDSETPSRHVKSRRKKFVSGFYALLRDDELSEYLGHLSLLCNHPGRFSIRLHEVSSEPKTKAPKVFLSYAENVEKEKTLEEIILKQNRAITFCYEIKSMIFSDSKDSMEKYDCFLKEADDFGLKILQNYRFYEVDPETQTSDFKIVVIYARWLDDEDESLSRVGVDRDRRIDWGGLSPAKVTY